MGFQKIIQNQKEEILQLEKDKNKLDIKNFSEFDLKYFIFQLLQSNLLQ